MAAIGYAPLRLPGAIGRIPLPNLACRYTGSLAPPGHGDIAPMAKLIDIVFHGPVFAGFTHLVGS